VALYRKDNIHEMCDEHFKLCTQHYVKQIQNCCAGRLGKLEPVLERPDDLVMVGRRFVDRTLDVTPAVCHLFECCGDFWGPTPRKVVLFESA